MPRATIPAHGREADEVLAELRARKDGDARFREGRTWSLVYYASDAHHALLQQAHNTYIAENALSPIAFQSLRSLEAQVVQATVAMLHGDDKAVGSMTSGGTESLILAVKTWRDRARRRRPWIRRPNIVLPASAHPAFDKAGHLLDITLRRVPVLADGKADVAAMRQRVNRNTVLLVGSAPQYPHGTVDPIPELGDLALHKHLPLHVDACFGGFILPWLEKLGVSMPAWDFRVPGVRSISADLHKYGYAAKGASTLLFRDMSDMRDMFFVQTDWMGGIYASPGLGGTRPGGPIAAAWAALQVMGEDGYLAKAEQAWEVAQRLRVGIAGIDGLYVLGCPESTIVTWAAQAGGPDVYAIADQLQERGWSVDRQQSPPCVHCSTNGTNLPVVDQYLADLAQAAVHVRAHPELANTGEAAMYGTMAKVPVDGLVNREVRKLMEQTYGGDGAMPPTTTSLPPVVHRALGRLDRMRSWLRRLRAGPGAAPRG